MKLKKVRKRVMGFVLHNTHGLDQLSANGNGTHSYPLREAPPNSREETERVERIVERVVEEHGETIKKLADE